MIDGGILTADLGAGAKRALLAQLLRKEGQRRNLFPLSSAQRRMWILWQLNPDSPVYNIPSAVRFEGLVDVALLKRCLDEVVRRHETLRTTFLMVNGQPMQVVASVMEAVIPVIDLQHLPSHEQEAEVLRLTTEDAKRPFDLTKGPLIRFSFLLLSQVELVMIVNMHHIVADGWSLGILTHEVETLYDAFSAGNPSPLPELPIQYVDYAVWQQRQIQGKALEHQQAYWKQQLADAPTLLGLPTDHPRPSMQTFNGAIYTLTLSPTLVEALRKLCQQEGATLFMSLLAAFKVLLERYTAQKDILVGTTVANRNRLEIEGLVGFFVNMLVLRTNLAGNPCFLDLLKQVRRTTLEAYEHQDMPFEQLLEILELDRDLSRPPLFQVVLTLYDAVLSADDPTNNLIQIDNGTAMFDLMLSVTDSGREKVVVDCQYNTGLFVESTIERMTAHFCALLEGIVANPRQHIASLPLLSKAECQQMLADWNATAAEYPEGQCLHQLFEVQVAHTPNAIAVVYPSGYPSVGVRPDVAQRLTYRELNAQANQLARYLRELGVGPDVLVGIYAERTLEMVVGLLGVLKAGGAYVPLDPTYPKERLAFMIEDSQVSVLLTQEKLASGIPPTRSPAMVCLDTDWETVAGESSENLAHEVRPDNLAYVIYTSGSTGRPKGAMISHRGLANYLTWCLRAYPIAEGQGAPVHSSISFDLTVTGLFAPLLAGRQVQLLTEALGGEALAATLHHETNYSLVKITPAHRELLSQQMLPEEAVGRTRAFIIGGENLLAKSIAFWQDHAPDTVLVNEYGPTEAVVGCCVYRVPAGEREEGVIPIGRPIINTQLYILDANLHPVPIGVPGELYIGGAGVARGYLSRPGLTAERFVPHLFSARPGGRLYRTGDVVRYLPDGNIQFLGRVDRQVKIRGFRIELEEIEATLLAHEDIEKCVVETMAPHVETSRSNSEIRYCARCGLASNYPGVTYDAGGVCSVCLTFDKYKSKVMQYFKTPDDLQVIFEKARVSKTSEYDCLVLFSGGKDSTYMLYRLVNMGLEVLVFTFDNGYLHEGAKANTLRVVDELGVDHVFSTTPFINEILADSLERYSNVCQGCFKALYTLAIKLAHEKGIRHIVTGLSRGQILETRLMDLFANNGDFSVDEVDRAVLEARKLYHRMDDAVSRYLNTDVFKGDAILDEVQFVDFYRYLDVSQDEIFTFLEEHTPWRNPVGTGCTTNCLANDVGIYVHTKERGFHNYALPTSWEVRLGRQTRDDALEEVNSSVDMASVKKILAAIGYNEPKERIEKHLVAYYVPRRKFTVSELRAHLSQKLPGYMIPSYFVSLDEIPLTLNGKVDRRALPAPDRGRPTLESAFVAPSTPAEEALGRIWAEVLRLERVGVHDNFLELGGDSILGIQIIARANQAGLHFTPKQLFEYQTIAGLAAVASVIKTVRAEQGLVTGPVPLTPIQHWFFEQALPDCHHFNQASFFEVRQSLEPVLLERTVRRLFQHHDGLRMRFERTASGWRQVNVGLDGPVPFTCIDFSTLPDGKQRLAVERAAAGLQASLNLSAGPLVRFALFDLGEQRPSRLLIVVHHLVIDGVSWQILLEDLATVYQQLSHGEEGRLPPKTTSFKHWAERMKEYAQSEELQQKVDHWLARSQTRVSRLPLDHSGGINTASSAQTVTASLSAKETQALLREVPRAYNTQINDVLLAALAQAFSRWTGRQTLLVDLEGHGREPLSEDVDLSRTVGWFTAIFPVYLDLGKDPGPGAALKTIKEQLRRVSDLGIGYGLLRYWGRKDIRCQLTSLPQAEVSFNYMGRFDQGAGEDDGGVFKLSSDSVGPMQSPRNRRAYLLDVSSYVTNERLTVNWIYSTAIHQRGTIERLAQEYIEALRAIIAHCQSPEAGGRTPSDFALANLDEQKLNRLARILEQVE